MVKKPMAILFITSTRIGDAVLSTGILDYLAGAYPESPITVACGWLPAPLFEGAPNVARVIPMRKAKWGGHWRALWAQVAGTRWDIVVDLRNSAVSRLVRAGERYIFGPHIDQSRHKAEQMAQVLALSSVPAPNLYFTAEQQAFADQFVRGGEAVLGVGPAANWPGKMWPAERFAEIIRFITGAEGFLPGAKVAVFAAPGEEAMACPVLESVPAERRINVIAQGNPAQAAAVIARCRFYIGNDSGLMHCAAAAGVPTFGLFGPSYPHLYRPWGDHTAYAATPETYDELTAFEGYDPKTQTETLMGSLSTGAVVEGITAMMEEGLNAED